jgi:hypothetical protein
VQKEGKVCVKSNNQELANYTITMYCNDAINLALSLWDDIQEKGKYCVDFVVDLQFCFGNDVFFEVQESSKVCF